MTDSRTVRCPHCGGLTLPTSVRSLEDPRVTALRTLAKDLEGCHEDLWRFIRALFETDPLPMRAKALSKTFGLNPYTMMSRFYRVGLPSPRTYLSFARCFAAAIAMQDERRTMFTIAIDCGWSSAPSMNRSIKTEFGISAQQFRDRHTPASMFELLRARLITPHVETLKDFRPTAELHRNAPRVQRQVAA